MSKQSDLCGIIRRSREHYELSLSEAAEMVGCTKSYLWELEQGRALNPTIKTLAGLASAYDLDLGEVAFLAASTCPGHEFRHAIRRLVAAKADVQAIAKGNDRT